MTTSKLIFVFLLTCISLCSFAQTEKQTGRFYLGLSTGIGGVWTNIDKDVKFSHQIGYAIPSEVSLNYSLNNTWTLQAFFGYHVKQFQVSADRLFTHSEFFRPTANFKDSRSNRTTGLNLLFRKPINSKQKIYLGAMIGYGLNSRKIGWGGTSSFGRNCDTSVSLIDFDRATCERALENDYRFKYQSNSYLSTGLFTDIRLPSKKIDEIHFLRFSIVHRMARNTPLQLEGVLTFYEFGEVIDSVPFSSVGSTLSLEVGWLMSL